MSLPTGVALERKRKFQAHYTGHRRRGKPVGWIENKNSPVIALASSVPCYHFPRCKAMADVEKEGKSLCLGCAPLHKGLEYPLHKAPETFKGRMLDWSIEIRSAFQGVLGVIRRDATIN